MFYRKWIPSLPERTGKILRETLEPSVASEATLVMARISSALPSLSKSDAAVATAIAANPESVILQSVTELAEMAGTSASTVVRCAQRLGFKGFQELRLTLARELSFEAAAAPTARGERPREVLAYVLAVQAEAIRSVPGTLDEQQFEAAAEAIARAGRVVFAGISASLGLIQEAAYVSRNIGLNADAPLDTHAQQSAASLLEPGDVCVTISQTGSSKSSVEAQTIAAAAGATTIAITGYLRSPLTEVSSYSLVAGNLSRTYELDSIHSRIALKAVLDALLVAVALQNPDRTEAAWKRVTQIQLRAVY